MDRTQKEETVAALHSALQDTGLVVVTQQSGMTVAEVTDLRRKMRAAGASFKVTKNRLARIALKGTQFEGLDGLFKGPTAVAYSKDPVAAAKVAADYAKGNDKFVILGGAMGDTALDPAGVKAVAQMPSREELIASIVSCIGAPAANIAGAIGAPASNIAGILSTLEEREAA